ncbi:hypothetical protein OK016_04240 [Vibrio chagasii]|nr:hypothetical protein [Vibrio chagasii]
MPAREELRLNAILSAPICIEPPIIAEGAAWRAANNIFTILRHCYFYRQNKDPCQQFAGAMASVTNNSTFLLDFVQLDVA